MPRCIGKTQRVMRIAASLNLILGSHMTSCSATQLAQQPGLVALGHSLTKRPSSRDPTTVVPRSCTGDHFPRQAAKCICFPTSLRLHCGSRLPLRLSLVGRCVPAPRKFAQLQQGMSGSAARLLVSYRGASGGKLEKRKINKKLFDQSQQRPGLRHRPSPPQANIAAAKGIRD